MRSPHFKKQNILIDLMVLGIPFLCKDKFGDKIGTHYEKWWTNRQSQRNELVPIIGSQSIKTQKTLPTSKSIVFETVLEKGETQLEAWFQDKNKNNVCGAHYIKLAKI